MKVCKDCGTELDSFDRQLDASSGKWRMHIAPDCRDALKAEAARLKAIINTPELASFSTGVALEAVQFVRPLLVHEPNGVHYCRSCSAGTSNGWQHWPGCRIAMHNAGIDEARTKLDAILARRQKRRPRSEALPSPRPPPVVRLHGHHRLWR